MQVILLENNKRLGDVGDVAQVKAGFARNFLIPNKKAIQATKRNIEDFKQRKDGIHKEIAKKKVHADQISSKLESKWVYILKQAGEDGRLYGSVSSADIVAVIEDQLHEKLHKNNVQLLIPIKYIGRHSVSINVFADIYVKVNIIVARTKEGAEIELKDARVGGSSPKAEKGEEDQVPASGHDEDVEPKSKAVPKVEKKSKSKKVSEDVSADAVEEATVAMTAKKAKKSNPKAE